MSEYFDLSRIAELQDLLGADAEAILASMLASMTTAIEGVETAIGAGELERATQAAHRARATTRRCSAQGSSSRC